MVLSGKKNRWYSQGRIQRNHGFRGREIQRGQRPFWHTTLRAKSSVLLYLYEADRIRKEDSKTWTILIKIICFIKRNSFPSCFSNDEDNPILIIVKTITICQIAVTKRSHHSQKGAEDTRSSRICKCQFC